MHPSTQTWVAITAVAIAALGSIATASMRWGVETKQIEVLIHRADMQRDTLATHGQQLIVEDKLIAVEDTKLDDILHRLDRIEGKIDTGQDQRVIDTSRLAGQIRAASKK